MGIWPRKKLRLCDVEERQPMLPKAREFLFFAPHTSERMATLPLISEVSAELQKAGKRCETHSIEDMKDSIMSLSVKLSRLKLSKEERTMLECLLRMKDAAVRLKLLCQMLCKNPEALILEMHAMDRDYAEKDRFDLAAFFYRLPGTRVLYLKDNILEYSAPIGRGLRILEVMTSRPFKEMASILSLDKARLREETPDQLRLLGQNGSRTMLIEIPAPSVDESEGIIAYTQFEKAYGFAISLCHTLGENDIEALERMLS